MTNVPIFEKQFKWFAEQNRLVSVWYQILDLRYERVKTKQIENENGKNNILDIKGNKFIFTAQKMKFSIKDFFSECDQIRSFLPIWSHLLKKTLISIDLVRHPLNLFHVNGLFVQPLKTLKNFWFSIVFRRHRKRPVDWNGVNV